MGTNVDDKTSRIEEDSKQKIIEENETTDKIEREDGEVDDEETTEDVEDTKVEEKGKALFPWMFSMAELCKGQKMILPVDGVYYPARIDDIHEPDL